MNALLKCVILLLPLSGCEEVIYRHTFSVSRVARLRGRVSEQPPVKVEGNVNIAEPFIKDGSRGSAETAASLDGKFGTELPVTPKSIKDFIGVNATSGLVGNLQSSMILSSSSRGKPSRGMENETIYIDDPGIGPYQASGGVRVAPEAGNTNMEQRVGSEREPGMGGQSMAAEQVAENRKVINDKIMFKKIMNESNIEAKARVVDDRTTHDKVIKDDIINVNRETKLWRVEHVMRAAARASNTGPFINDDIYEKSSLPLSSTNTEEIEKSHAKLVKSGTLATKQHVFNQSQDIYLINREKLVDSIRKNDSHCNGSGTVTEKIETTDKNTRISINVDKILDANIKEKNLLGVSLGVSAKAKTVEKESGLKNVDRATAALQASWAAGHQSDMAHGNMAAKALHAHMVSLSPEKRLIEVIPSADGTPSKDEVVRGTFSGGQVSKSLAVAATAAKDPAADVKAVAGGPTAKSSVIEKDPVSADQPAADAGRAAPGGSPEDCLEDRGDITDKADRVGGFSGSADARAVIEYGDSIVNGISGSSASADRVPENQHSDAEEIRQKQAFTVREGGNNDLDARKTV